VNISNPNHRSIPFRSPSFLLACGGSALEEFGQNVQLSLVVSVEVGVERGDVPNHFYR
jgi:hypothetical protein